MKHQISCIEDIKVLLNIYYKFILIEFNFRLQEMCHFESVIKIFLYFIKRQFLLKWEFWLLTSQYMHIMPKIIVNINYYLKIILSLVCIVRKNILYFEYILFFEFEINITRKLKINNPFLISINSLILTIDDATLAPYDHWLLVSNIFIYFFILFFKLLHFFHKQK